MTDLLTRSSLVDVRLWRHQQEMLIAPSACPSVELFFLISGYGAGKSFTGAMLIITIAFQYAGYDVTVGLGSDTIKRLRQTLLADLFRLCAIFGISYQEHRQEGTFRIGTVLFVIIALMNPGNVFGHNFSIFIGDEIDELSQEKALQAFRAIQERTRVELPDGRMPYSVFMTTAQGLRGTYQIVNDLQDKQIPYVLIRGRTVDNLALPAAYYRRLFAVYNETERRVFLEGFFASLTTGRVYYDYDESVNRLRENDPMVFRPSSGDTIHVGQDFNTGYSMGTAYVKRDDTLYVVNEWSFTNIGHAPKIMRRAYPENEILWYPDVSGKEIMAGYKEEIREHEIEMRIGTRNPSVTDRIFVMNKMFAMKRLYLMPWIRRLSMALKVRQFDDNGDPEKGKGPEAPDHPCFAAGTMIDTVTGRKPIETIQTGDMVLTREGPKRVVDAGMTGVKEVHRYASFESTPEHPVLTENGFVPASTLTQSNILCRMRPRDAKGCENLWRMKESLPGSFTDAIRPAREGRIATITDVLRLMLKLTRNIFTGQFGFTSTVRLLADTTFITVTGILSTTLRRTLNAWIQASIDLFQSSILKSLKRICARPERRQRRGIAARKAANGIESTAEKIVLLGKGLIADAKNAGIFLSELSTLGSVPRIAFQGIAGNQGLMTRQENAAGARNDSRPASTAVTSVVANPALHICVPVYDITVEEKHEYFANGVLVSNCDSAEYPLWRIVRTDPDFSDIYTATRQGRAKGQKAKEAA